MIAYTNIKGRGRIHGYDFVAATAMLPYGASWTNQPRDKETLGNRAVLELQANAFGEMLLIRSQVVVDQGRPYGVTQYVHPVPTEDELAGETPQAFMAKHVGNLLYFGDFCSPVTFPDLDDSTATSKKVLAPQVFMLPPIPGDAPVTCDDAMLGSLLAELWKNCDSRYRRDRGFTPVRICVCDSAHATDTLEAGCLFMAKTVIPRLPLSVRNILSVTIGAKWDAMNAYENTACCIAQFEGDRIGVGYDLVNRTFIPHLQTGEGQLGMALLREENLEYYRHMEQVASVSPLCADFHLALSMFALRQYLTNPERFAKGLAPCYEQWKNLEDDIRVRIGDMRNPPSIRDILYPIERDILLRQEEQAADDRLSKAVYTTLVSKAFSLAEALPARWDELCGAYAKCLALPRLAENEGQPCFETLLQGSRLDLKKPPNAALFVAALLEYCKTHTTGKPLGEELINQLTVKIRAMGEENLTAQRDHLLACISACSRNGQPQRVINSLCITFALDRAYMDSKVVERFNWSLEDSTRFPLALKEYFDYQSARTDPLIRQDMLAALDQRFRAVALTPEAWRDYLALCTAIGYTTPDSLANAWVGLDRLYPTQAMADTELDAISAFCRAAGDDGQVCGHVFRHYDARGAVYRHSTAMQRQMRRWAERYPTLLAPRNDHSAAWDALRGELLAENLNGTLAEAETWAALRQYPQHWKNKAKPAFMDATAWPNLPQVMEAGKPEAIVAEACMRVLGGEPPTLANAQEQLDCVATPADWYVAAMRGPVLAHVAGGLGLLWDAATAEEDVQRLQRLLESLGRMLNGEALTRLMADPAAQAVALYMEASATLLRWRSQQPPPLEDMQAEAAALAGRLASSGKGEGIALLLRKRFAAGNRQNRPLAQLFMEFCLFSLSGEAGCLQVAWGDALAWLDASLERASLNRLRPWTDTGRHTLRTLLTCLTVSDRLSAAAGLRPLQYYLCEQCPRLTRAVRKRRMLRQHLRGSFYRNARQTAEKTRQTLGDGAVAWMLD